MESDTVAPRPQERQATTRSDTLCLEIGAIWWECMRDEWRRQLAVMPIGPRSAQHGSCTIFYPFQTKGKGMGRASAHRRAALVACAQWSSASTSEAAHRATHSGCSSVATCKPLSLAVIVAHSLQACMSAVYVCLAQNRLRTFQQMSGLLYYCSQYYCFRWIVRD